ncbi:MAG TPA: plastocyanin/azurin family copper-binding protein, partial [Nitrososphaeraceae archaeon]|nr:plastocyanin/azurin family copper-binding protein [Nitrososphaeraceae archaeon]
AATQGNPAYDPSDLTVKKGQTILVDNVDAMPHTVTNGAGPSDSTSGKIFDTSIMNAGEFKVLETADIDPAKYDYYCTVHPYMLGTLTVQ